jgi:hypothetical protein
VIGSLGFSRRGVFIGEGASSEVDRVGHTHRGLLLGDGTRKLADGDQLMWKETVLVRGDGQPVGNPKRKV